MQDSVKVFTDIPIVTGYVEVSNDPLVAQFQFNTTIRFFVIKNDTIISHQEGWQYNAEVGDTAGAIYTGLYTSILSVCQAQGFPTPTQKDIFCYIPISLSQIFADVPAIA